MYLKTKNHYYLSKFKSFRNKLKHLLPISKKNYYNNYFQLKKDSIKDVWKGIKQLITLKKANHTFSTLIEVENEKISNPTDIASKFNDYFTSIGPKLAANIPSVNSTFSSFLKRPLSNSFMLFPTDRYEIENLIMNLTR